jgi:hypothetical protein
VFAVFCAGEDRVAPPGDSEARRVLDAAGTSLAAAAKSIDDVEAALTTFARTRILRDRGIPRSAAAVDAVRASKNSVRELRSEQQRLQVRATSAADAKAFSERANVSTKAAADAVAAATAIMTDPTVVDTAAEERERRMAAALRARDEDEAKRKAAREAEETRRKAAASTAQDDARRRAEAEEARRRAAAATAQEDAKRRAEELEQRRKDAEIARVAAAEATKRKLEEQQAQQQANAAASGAEKKKITEQKHGVVMKGLGDIDLQLGAALASVAATLAIANAPRDQRARAQANEQRIKALQARAKDVRARSDASLQRAPAEALATVSRAELELAALAVEARSVTAAAGTAVVPVTGGSKDPTVVPSCVVDVFAPPGVVEATVALDGAKPVPLPTKVRVSSGRHSFVVAQGARTSRQSELVVCGRVQSIAVNAPK